MCFRGLYHNPFKPSVRQVYHIVWQVVTMFDFLMSKNVACINSFSLYLMGSKRHATSLKVSHINNEKFCFVKLVLNQCISLRLCGMLLFQCLCIRCHHRQKNILERAH